MKTIEEKAQAYDEALSRVKNIMAGEYETTFVYSPTLFEEIFPELKEGEDEKMRAMAIKAVYAPEAQSCIKSWGINPDDVIAWLEKQGEQKPADKVEPKFKVGDWVIGRATNNEPRQIAEITDNGYKSTYGGWYGFSWEDDIHLWTIQDAKDGDVLTWDNSKCIALFKNIYDKESFSSHGFIGHCTGTFESRLAFHDIEGAHPATKEQRDTLEKAMTEAGYCFDFDKKELKKIRIEDLVQSIEVQKPAEWSEEDEQHIDSLLKRLDGLCRNEFERTRFAINEDRDWLKSLKDRVQPKQEWSKEDEREIKHCIDFLNHPDMIKATPTIVKDCKNWLKSLKPQNRWKPSDEQIKVLDEVIRNPHLSTAEYNGLIEFMEQLKKLKD